jgi:hypothetical protein
VLKFIDRLPLSGRTWSGSSVFFWIAIVELLLGFLLADACVVAWSAAGITGTELVAIGFSYTLIAFGTLVTAFLAAYLSPDPESPKELAFLSRRLRRKPAGPVFSGQKVWRKLNDRSREWKPEGLGNPA